MICLYRSSSQRDKYEIGPENQLIIYCFSSAFQKHHPVRMKKYRSCFNELEVNFIAKVDTPTVLINMYNTIIII